MRDLHSPGDDEERIAPFMRRVEDVDGIPLQVVEATGQTPAKRTVGLREFCGNRWCSVVLSRDKWQRASRGEC